MDGRTNGRLDNANPRIASRPKFRMQSLFLSITLSITLRENTFLKLISCIFSLSGLSECSWSSCREGCTGDQAECVHVYVQFQPLTPVSVSSSTPAETVRRTAPLKVSVNGCGYPPSVNCSMWIQEFGRNNSKFPCYYSE